MLTLIPANPETSNDVVSAQKLISQCVVDGFVVYSVAKGDPYLKAVEARGLPTIICDQPTDEKNLPFVGIDDRRAIAPAASALLDSGHRKIGILSIRLFRTQRDNAWVDPALLEKAELHVQQSRIAGALDVMVSRGIDPLTVPIYECWLNDQEHNASAVENLLAAHPDLTAVLCTTDSLALAVIDYADSHGISVPGQLSVTGFDGTAAAISRNLSTVVQPNREKGARTAKILFELIEQDIGNEPATKSPPQRVYLDTHFRPGSTIAPVSAGSS